MALQLWKDFVQRILADFAHDGCFPAVLKAGVQADFVLCCGAQANVEEASFQDTSP